MEKVQILGIAGSLRKDSINKSLLRHIAGLDIENVDITIFDLKDIPMFNGDIEAAGDPESVLTFKSAIFESDAVLIVTPEYNAGTPALVKNAIDWASRPFGDKGRVLDGKPVALTGASPGRFGTVKSQLHLRDVLLNVNCTVVQKPQVYVGGAPQLMDEDGNYTDERTTELLKKLIIALTKLARP